MTILFLKNVLILTILMILDTRISPKSNNFCRCFIITYSIRAMTWFMFYQRWDIVFEEFYSRFETFEKFFESLITMQKFPKLLSPDAEN